MEGDLDSDAWPWTLVPTAHALTVVPASNGVRLWPQLAGRASREIKGILLGSDLQKSKVPKPRWLA